MGGMLMSEDFESKYLREIALVDDMKAEIEDIKKQFTSLNESLLETQRTLVSFMIFHDANYYYDAVRKKKPEATDSFFNQMTSDASEARTAVKTSKEPFSVYSKFVEKCQNKLKEVEITLVDI